LNELKPDIDQLAKKIWLSFSSTVVVEQCQQAHQQNTSVGPEVWLRQSGCHNPAT